MVNVFALKLPPAIESRAFVPQLSALNSRWRTKAMTIPGKVSLKTIDLYLCIKLDGKRKKAIVFPIAYT